MPLKLAHHKSYHPYNAANIERVRQDEEQARLSEQLEVEVGKSEESKRKLDILRGKKGEKSESKKEDNGEQPHSHTNFWEHLEQPSKSKDGAAPNNTDMQISQPNPRWYDSPGDLSKAVDKDSERGGNFSNRMKRRREDPLYDTQIKDRYDPLSNIHRATAELDSDRRSRERRRRNWCSGSSHMPTETHKKSKRERREEKERARARNL